MEHRQRAIMRPVVITIAALGAIVLLASGYCILSLLGRVPMSWPILFGWLAALSASNGILLFLCWKRRGAFSPTAQLTALFWGGIAVWYWLPAPACAFLGMNFDRIQLTWAAFAFIWEVPVVGWLWVVWCLRVFRPLQAFLEGKAPAANPARLYQAALRYPVVIAEILGVITAIGYVCALIQMGYFGLLPPLEQVKTVLLGIASGAFHGVFFYFCLDIFLRPVRSRIEQTFEASDVAKGKLVHKIAGITLTATIGSAAMLSLFALQSFQLIIKEHAETQLRNALEQFATAERSGAAPAELKRLLNRLRSGARGTVALLDPGEHVPQDAVASETRRAISQRRAGIVSDGKRDLKLVGFLESAVLGKQVVLTVMLADFYGPLKVIARYLVLAGLFAMILIVSIVVIVSLMFTKAIRTLASAVKRAETSDAPYTLHLDTADELEDLSHACAHFIHESRTLRGQLEGSLQEMEDVLHVVSHDLRAPLINIEGFSKRLEPIMRETLRTLEQVTANGQASGLHNPVEAVRAQLQTQFAQSLQFISRSVETMDTLLSSLLAVSRVGRKADPIQPNDLNQILDEGLATFAHQLTECAIQVIRHPLPASVPCRRNEINQVFSNLLSNAIKYMGSSAQRFIEIGATSHRNHVECFMRDTGIGINPPDQERIFQLFARLQDVDVPGEGIGLTYVKKILRSHGGKIWVVSQRGQGSTFFFTLPMRLSPRLSASQPSGSEGAPDPRQAA